MSGSGSGGVGGVADKLDYLVISLKEENKRRFFLMITGTYLLVALYNVNLRQPVLRFVIRTVFCRCRIRLNFFPSSMRKVNRDEPNIRLAGHLAG